MPHIIDIANAKEMGNDAPRRRWIAFASIFHAGIFGAMTLVLPWRDWTLFAGLTTVVGCAHLLVAMAAVVGHRLLAPLWRLQAALSLAWLTYLGWGLLSSAWYLHALYGGGLGTAVGAALSAIVVVLLAITLPISCWGIAATRGLRLTKPTVGALLLGLLLAAGRLWSLERQAQGVNADPGTITTVEAAIEPELDLARLPKSLKRAPVTPTGVSRCDAPPDAQQLTMVVTYSIVTDRITSRPISRCIQAPNPTQLAARLRQMLDADARHGPVKLDLITRWAPVLEHEPLSSLSLNPGVDGLCAANSCLMPWQLVMLDSFNSHAPLASVPDARLGVSLQALRQQLREPTAPLVRIATKSWLATDDGLHSIGRSTETAALTDARLSKATTLAEEYVLASQQRNGRFNYTVDPFSGALSMGEFSIARQAGTTLVVCELAQRTLAVDRLVRRSLNMLAKLEEQLPAADEPLSVMPFRIGLDEPARRIGPSTLTLAALLRCRDHTNKTHDALISRLGRTLLALQRDDGSFHHHIDRASGKPMALRRTMFVDGQLVLALTLLEAVADEGAPFPARDEVHAAVERAMSYFASQYWDVFIGDFFFLEENWHCLAAAAALDVHRHDAYEQFCLDYVSFKSRVVLDASDGVSPDLFGGYGLTNVVPPHITATAGFGEALTAALAIKRVRKLDRTADEQLLRAVLGYLLRNQWTTERCWACSPRRRVLGGFSEHMASPRIRIDYVQHTWAALGHGGRQLGML